MTENLIIHFTKNLNALKNIIQTSSFKLFYCGEIFNMGTEKISSAAHPMVCFSEYSLDELENKNITYGKYGIALTKDWAIKNRLNPVIYVESTSQTAQGLGVLLKARQGKLGSVELPSKLRLPIMQLKCFTKNVIGYNSFLKKKDFDFKSENEWRYVPAKKEIGGELISVNLSDYKGKENQYNEKISGYTLKFSIADIKKIFVSRISEIGSVSKARKIDKQIIAESNWKTK